MDKKSRTELYELAKSHKIPNRSKMTKAELLAALMTKLNVKSSPVKKSLSPKKNNFKFEFGISVDFIDDGKEPDVPIEKKMKAALDWYIGFAEEQTDGEDASFVSASLKGDARSGYKIVMELANVDDKDKNMYMEIISNPDEDGNNPLKFKGKLFEVVCTSEVKVL